MGHPRFLKGDGWVDAGMVFVEPQITPIRLVFADFASVQIAFICVVCG